MLPHRVDTDSREQAPLCPHCARRHHRHRRRHAHGHRHPRHRHRIPEQPRHARRGRALRAEISVGSCRRFLELPQPPHLRAGAGRSPQSDHRQHGEFSPRSRRARGAAQHHGQSRRRQARRRLHARCHGRLHAPQHRRIRGRPLLQRLRGRFCSRSLRARLRRGPGTLPQSLVAQRVRRDQRPPLHRRWRLCQAGRVSRSVQL